jgi:energy-converting hydrogenase A subunit R
MSKPKVIGFDLEGPLSPQDNAFEVMEAVYRRDGLLEAGHRIFSMISYYDDLLTEAGKVDYEPGDTLALIVPFLLHHGLREDDVLQVSAGAKLVDGAAELMESLRSHDWAIHIISTSYEQHAYGIARRLDVPAECVFCTAFPIGTWREALGEVDFSLVAAMEQRILDLFPPDPDDAEKTARVRELLDRFYWEMLPGRPLSEIWEQMSVMGGRRKAGAVEDILRRVDPGLRLRDVVVVGDSITDIRMLEVVEAAGGLAIVFNGNRFCLPQGTVGVGSTSIRDLWPLLSIWENGGGRKGIRDHVVAAEQEGPPFYHWLVGTTERALESVIDLHGQFRRAVREGAAQLG